MMIVKILLIITQHTRHTIEIIVNAVFDIAMNLETTTSAVAAIISSYRMALTIFSCGHIKLSLKHIFYDDFSIRIVHFYTLHSFFCICHNEVAALALIHDVCAVILVSGHFPSTKVVENNDLLHAFHSPLLKILIRLYLRKHRVNHVCRTKRTKHNHNERNPLNHPEIPSHFTFSSLIPSSILRC
nr:MAG TPA: hypothetical protein [Caudoviricetes sp.]